MKNKKDKATTKYDGYTSLLKQNFDNTSEDMAGIDDGATYYNFLEDDLVKGTLEKYLSTKLTSIDSDNTTSIDNTVTIDASLLKNFTTTTDITIPISIADSGTVISSIGTSWTYSYGFEENTMLDINFIIKDRKNKNTMFILDLTNKTDETYRFFVDNNRKIEKREPGGNFSIGNIDYGIYTLSENEIFIEITNDDARVIVGKNISVEVISAFVTYIFKFKLKSLKIIYPGNYSGKQIKFLKDLEKDLLTALKIET